MTIKLTEFQKKHFPTIKWLVDDTRQTGKSYLLALAFVEKALEFRGVWVYVFDHYPIQQGREHLLSIVRNILGSEMPNDIAEKVEFKRDSFRINN